MVRTRKFLFALGSAVLLGGCSLVLPVSSHQRGRGDLDGSLGVEASIARDLDGSSTTSNDASSPQGLDGSTSQRFDGSMVSARDAELASDGSRIGVDASPSGDGGAGQHTDASGDPIDTGAPRSTWYLPGTAGHPYAYTTNPETVRDEVTGLMWQRAATVCGQSQADAIAHCEGLVLGTYDDWRLPTRLELLTVAIEDSPSAPTASSVFAINISFHWTSTTVAADPNSAWIVDFGRAAAETAEKESLACCWCVRGVGPPDPALVVQERSVFDPRTELDWIPTSGDNTTSLETAAAFCSLFGGRLPRALELHSIVDERSRDPALDPRAFPTVPSGPYWTSTQVDNLNRVVDLALGVDDVLLPGDSAYVQCVR